MPINFHPFDFAFCLVGLQDLDEQSSDGRFKSVDVPAEISILDQHVQRLHHACMLWTESFLHILISCSFDKTLILYLFPSQFQGFLQYGVPSTPEKLIALMNKVYLNLT